MIALIALSLPVLGIVETTKETFAGSLTGVELVLRSDDRPADCHARLVMGTSGYGSGSLVCSDGRAGHFSVHILSGHGTAYGSLDGKALTLSIG